MHKRSKRYKKFQRRQARLLKKKTPKKEKKATASKQHRSSGFRDNFGKLHQYDELIFPIIYHNTKTDLYHAIGTGYFFHANGGFITAKHVLFDKGKQLHPCYAIQTLEDGRRFKREIRVFFAHPEADIGVGMLKGQLIQGGAPKLVLSLAISLTPPQIGDAISTYAFPKSEVSFEGDSQIGIFQGTWSRGTIKKLVPKGEHHLLKSDTYETNMHIAARASGGPVLRGVHIVGVNSTGWDTEEGQEPLSNITPVYEVLDMVITDGDGKETTVRDLMQSGHVGFAK